MVCRLENVVWKMAAILSRPQCLNRNALLFKLPKRGMTDKMLHILKSMFSNAKRCAKWNCSLGEAFENLYVVLQGAVTSPSLFDIPVFF